MIKIKQLVVGPLETNCYLLREADSDEAVIIDPGADANRIADACDSMGAVPRLIVNTHAHFDHIGANGALKRHFPGLQIAAGALDAAAMADPVQNLSAGFGVHDDMPLPEVELEEGDKVEVGGDMLRVRFTPGHTRGGISLISDNNSPPAVFCGDLIFAQGMGRTDLPGGNMATLRESIRKLLSSCTDETVLYPGHENPITVGERRKQLEL